MISIIGDSGSGWNAEFASGQPALGYALKDAAGVTIAAGTTTVNWVRVGGSEQCGGPREANVLIDTAQSTGNP